MEVKSKRVRKFLSKKIQQLNDIVADLDSLVTEIGTEFYRVSIFGSARIKPDTKEYKTVHDLAYALATKGVDIVTGGGPGLMEAANLGAKKGGNQSRSYGLAIDLPFETDANSHLDVKYQHKRFSTRLDEFMRISHAVVITPGGIGTMLELCYTWQLLQVNHISERPIILLGDMWTGLLEWLEKYPMKANLMDRSDMDRLFMANSAEEVVSHLGPAIDKFYKDKDSQNKAST